MLVSQFHGQNISDVTFTTGCIIELDADYTGSPVTNSAGAGTSTSWMDCKAFCESNAAKYFTWLGPTHATNQRNSCWCRNVKTGTGPSTTSGRVFGEVAGCGNEY